MKRLLSSMLAATIVALAWFACDDGDETQKVVSITMNKTTLTLVEGQSETLSFTISPGDATNQKVSWTSSNTAVATVNNGAVTAVKEGSTDITVTTDDGNKTAVCKVTVTSANVAVTGIALNKSTLELTEGDSETLTFTITPADATNQKVSWESSDASVASVSDGKVTALKAGSTDIKVTTEDGNKTATCKVTVSAPAEVAVTEVLITPEAEISLTIGENVTLSATVLPENASNKQVTWESLNPDIATVSEGIVTAVSEGTAKIRATAADQSGKYAEKSITVKPKDTPGGETAAEFDNSNFGLYKGILVGSSGTIKIEINNGVNVSKAYIVIDGVADELTSLYTFAKGVAISNAKFSGKYSSFNISIDADGSNPVLSDIQIDGHSEVKAAIIKQTSTNVVTAYEGTTVGGNDHKGVLNLIRNDNTYYGIQRGDDGVGYLFQGEIAADGSFTGSSETVYMGLHVALTYSGKFESNGTVAGTWQTTWSGGTNEGTFTGKKTL